MNRFFWINPEASSSLLAPDDLVAKQPGIRLYDGNEKTPFDNGALHLTSKYLIWIDEQDRTCIMGLHLSLIIFTEDERAGMGAGRSAKVIIHVNPPPANAVAVQVSDANHIKLSFRDGGMTEFSRRLSDQLARRLWEMAPPVSGANALGRRERTGITGIEKTLQAEQSLVNVQISKAFEDLNQLMKMAKDTVTLSKSLVAKVKNRQGEITDDETTQLKSYLLSLGVNDPITRDVCGSDNIYYQKLAREIADLMVTPIKENGGLMTLTDVYCRVNRARGFELVSPEDLLRACKNMAALKLSTELRVFDTGVAVLETRDLPESAIVARTRDALDKSPLTADMLAKILGVSVILAKEMLLLTEKRGLACRDESVEGLRFYPNAFTEA